MEYIEQAIIQLLTERGKLGRPEIGAILGIDLTYGKGHKGYFVGCVCQRLAEKEVLEFEPHGERKTSYYKIKE